MMQKDNTLYIKVEYIKNSKSYGTDHVLPYDEVFYHRDPNIPLSGLLLNLIVRVKQLERSDFELERKKEILPADAYEMLLCVGGANDGWYAKIKKEEQRVVIPVCNSQYITSNYNVSDLPVNNIINVLYVRSFFKGVNEITCILVPHNQSVDDTFRLLLNSHTKNHVISGRY